MHIFLRVTIPENVPFGTPLANLNMEVKDTDTGTNSVFTLRYLNKEIFEKRGQLFLVFGHKLLYQISPCICVHF